jgi:hypothetical protein
MAALRHEKSSAFEAKGGEGADELADVGASSILIIDFLHRAQAEICARCARPWPKEMFSPGIS